MAPVDEILILNLFVGLLSVCALLVAITNIVFGQEEKERKQKEREIKRYQLEAEMSKSFDQMMIEIREENAEDLKVSTEELKKMDFDDIDRRLQTKQNN